MRVQDYIVRVTREAMTEAFNYAKAVPGDKLEWQPLGTGQSVLRMARELAKCSDWALSILAEDEKSLEADVTTNDDMGKWATLDACEAACQKKLTRYCAFVAGFPDDRFTETKDLPFGPNRSMKTFTMLELLDYVRWNASYHQGQIAYIQTLYGDSELH